MKKFFAILLSVVSAFTVFAFSACGENEKSETEKKTITVYAPDGAPALSIAKFINDNEDFGTGATVSYNVVAAANIGGVMQQGAGDIIIMPVNAASKLYAANASDKYKMAAVVTHGNLYVMCKEDLTVEGLKGKVVGVIGQGNVPDLTFRAALVKNGVEYEASESAVDGKVALKYYSDASELLPALKTGKIAVGLLPEPAANKLVGMDSAFKYALDLQKLYDAEAKTYPQAVVMVKSSVIAAYPELVAAFGGKIAGAVSWVKDHPADAASAVAGVLPEGVTPSLSAANLNATVVENCKIYWQSAADAEIAVKEYIDAIIELEQKAAKAVSDEFFAL
ncbi:MAG: ABC transporter substrate-binding protein [Clostridia bacterium]|nr:ABC transporter substrate-binding protein [Clostridia bacterium]